MIRYQLHRTTLSAILSILFVTPLLIAADGLPSLRIMPLGDSITKGNGSPDDNGYRGKLRAKLISAQKGTNASTDMIGSLRNGDMRDNDHEGHSGKLLADIREYLELSLPAKPNVVLVHAGTNNMDLEKDLDKADTLIESIIDRLIEGSPGVTVLVAPVIWANDSRMQVNTDVFNMELGVIINRKQQDGQHVLPVPIEITLADLSDKKHPNGAGYSKMAAAWHDAIIEASSKGWIQPPVEVDPGKLLGMGLGYGNAS